MSKKKLFDKILIANRGEIAVRIMRALNKLNIKSAAVHSEADNNALHTIYADEAYYIGASEPDTSYLNVKNIMRAVRASGAQAVHPGYGFLSEKSRLPKSLKRENVTFIGPSIKAIEQMGDKIQAKKIAEAAGVNTVPGYMGAIKDVEKAKEIARNIGFPVIIKAAAGGGGRGMRVVNNEDEVEDAFITSCNEAKNSFNDDRVFIEKFIETPRHIEVQLLADQYGNIVCLGERECSIQRHHQKVIEEAPSSFIDEETRQEMYRQVISLAQKVNYYSAGTVEFIVDKYRNFYFLEMNTRLQVEHCVTELITGVDIVEQMIRIAAGEKLQIKQSDIKLNGWAFESRIYAEDPSRGFLPSSGRISTYQIPENGNGIRIESGIYEGGEVSMFYDPMIAKLCVHAEDRDAAIDKMQFALGQTYIEGISHNVGFLQAIFSNERFIRGDLSTNFIEEEYPEGFSGAEITTETNRILLAVAMHIFMTDARRADKINGQLPGFDRKLGNRWIITIDDHQYPVIIREKESGYHIRSSRVRIDVESEWMIGNKLFRGYVDDKPVSIIVEPYAGGYYLTYGGRTIVTAVRSPRVAELEQYIPKRDHNAYKPEILSPIAGNIVAIKVEEGEEIKAGQELITVEAMKMENVLCAEYPSIVKEIHINPEDNVVTGQLLITLESKDEE